MKRMFIVLLLIFVFVPNVQAKKLEEITQKDIYTFPKKSIIYVGEKVGDGVGFVLKYTLKAVAFPFRQLEKIRT